MSKELTPLKELKDLKNAFVGHCKELKCGTNYIKVCENKFSDIEKELKALEIIKENIIVSCDESEKDKPCLVLGTKVNKDKLVIFYETFDKKKIDLLKEVLKND